MNTFVSSMLLVGVLLTTTGLSGAASDSTVTLQESHLFGDMGSRPSPPPSLRNYYPPAQPKGERERALAELWDVGARFRVDENVPGEPLVEVKFMFRRVRDADLARLKWLPKLRKLDLSYTQVSDANRDKARQVLDDLMKE